MSDPHTKLHNATVAYRTAVAVSAITFMAGVTLQWGTAGFLLGVAALNAFIARVARRDQEQARDEIRREGR